MKNVFSSRCLKVSSLLQGEPGVSSIPSNEWIRILMMSPREQGASPDCVWPQPDTFFIELSASHLLQKSNIDKLNDEDRNGALVAWRATGWANVALVLLYHHSCGLGCNGI